MVAAILDRPLTSDDRAAIAPDGCECNDIGPAIHGIIAAKQPAPHVRSR